MNLAVYLATPNNTHKQQGNPSVKANALYKTRDNFNCYLTATEAMHLAENLLMKARLILDEEIDDAVVHLWNQGQHRETLRCGLNKSRRGPRRRTA